MKFTFFENVFTSQMNVSILVVVVLCVLAILLGKKVKTCDYTKEPSRFMLCVESFVDLINNFCRANLGEKHFKKYAPYLFTLFTYLLISNAIGILGVSNPTQSLAITSAMAIITTGIIYWTRFRENGFVGFCKAFAEPVVVMVPLNIISVVTLPLSMGIRLFVNLISGAAFITIGYGVLGYFAPLVMPALHLVFDLFFGAVQAFVFFLLTLINIQQELNIEE